MLVRKRGSDNRRSWLQLYDRFEEIHGIHILEEAKRCGISGLNYAVKNGLAKKLYLVAKGFVEVMNERWLHGRWSLRHL